MPCISLGLRRHPCAAGQFRAEELKTQLLYLRSQYGHTEMVRVSTVLPVLLWASRLGLLEVRPGS